MEGSDMPLDDGEDYIVNNSDDLLQALSFSSVVPQALQNAAAQPPNMGANVLPRQNTIGSTMMHSSAVVGDNRSHNSSIGNTFNGGGLGPGTSAWKSQEEKRQHDLEELHQRLERNQEQQRQKREAQKQEELGRLIQQQQEQEKQQQQQQMALGNHNMNSSNHHNTLMNGGSIHGALANSIGGPFPMTQQPAPPNAGTQQEQQIFNFNHPQQQRQQQHHVVLTGSNHSHIDNWRFPMTNIGLPVPSSPILPNIASRAPNTSTNPPPTKNNFAKLQQDSWLRSQYPQKHNSAAPRTGTLPISSFPDTSSNGSTLPFHDNSDNGNSAAGGDQPTYMTNEGSGDASQGPLLESDSLAQDMMNVIASNTLPPSFSKNFVGDNPLPPFTSNNKYNSNDTGHVTRNGPLPTTSHNSVDDYNNDNTSDFSNNKNNSDNDDNDDSDFDNLFNTGNVDNTKGGAPSIRPMPTASQILSPPQHSNEAYDSEMNHDSSGNNNNTDAMGNSSNHPLTSFDSFSSFVPANNQSKNYDPVSVQLSNAIGRQIEAVEAGNTFMAPSEVIDIFEENDYGEDSGVSALSLENTAKRPRLTPPPPPSSMGETDLVHHNIGNRSNMQAVPPSFAATMSYLEPGANAPLLINKRKPGSGTPIGVSGRPTLPNTYNASRTPLDTARVLQQVYGNSPYLAQHQKQQQLPMGQLQQHPPEFLQLPEDFIPRWDQLMPVPKPQRTFRSFSLSLLNVREFTITGLSVSYEGPPSSVAGLRADIKKMSRSCGEKAVFDRDVDGVEGGRWRIPLVRREQTRVVSTRMVEKENSIERKMLDKAPKHSDFEQHPADTPAPPLVTSFLFHSNLFFFHLDLGGISHIFCISEQRPNVRSRRHTGAPAQDCLIEQSTYG
jgi:hypothetical protein